MAATKPITCTCGSTFVDKEAIHRHAAAKNDIARSRGESATHEHAVDGNEWRRAVSARSCPLCNRKPFPFFDGLRDHVQSKHPRALGVVDREIAMLESTINIQSLQGTANAGSDSPFPCLGCRKKCRSLKGLCQHTLAAHGEQATIDVLRLSLGETVAPAPVQPTPLPVCEGEGQDRAIQREQRNVLAEMPVNPPTAGPWDMVTSALSAIGALQSAHRSHWTLLLSTLSKQYLREVGFTGGDAPHDGDGTTAQTRSDGKAKAPSLPHRRTPSEKAEIIRRLIRDVD